VASSQSDFAAVRSGNGSSKPLARRRYAGDISGSGQSLGIGAVLGAR